VQIPRPAFAHAVLATAKVRDVTERTRIRKVVIPAAGLGTRFLPATKAVPKELLPIVDVPTIQYIVEEALAAGIKDIIVVNGRGKGAIEDHFDVAFELETVLKSRGKEAMHKQLAVISDMTRIISVRQKQPQGLGHAVLCAAPVVGDEPFGVILGDDLIDSPVPAIAQLIGAYLKHGMGVVALMEVPPEETNLYGIAAGTILDARTLRIHELREKPSTKTAPSNLAVIGRYVLPPSIFGILERTKPGVGGEIQLTDGLAELARTEGLIGYRFDGERYDAGDRLGFLKANIAYALKRAELREPLLAYLRTMLGKN
jgi:UTP--glucose-1-phosphate uridylyltransferase